MNELFSKELAQKIRIAKIIAVTVIDDPEDAVPLANILLEEGITAIELTLRTEAAFQCLALIRKECPEMLAGVGTVLNPGQVSEALEHGAAFGVAPGLNPNIVRMASESGLSFAPGIVTPSDIEVAVELGCRLLKFFPAEPSGGLPYFKSFSAPYAHLGLEYIPLGGLTVDNFTSYLENKAIPAVGGSWIAPRKWIKGKNWDGIRSNAREAVQRCSAIG